MKAIDSDVDYSAYADDPVGFVEEVLGDVLTPDLKAVCESVRVNQTTIAQSGNGTGKSWLGARLAIWFFVSQVRPCVFLFAAPPLDNLANILWAELADVYTRHPELISGCRPKYLNVTRNEREIIQGLSIPKQGTDADKKAAFSGKHHPSQMFIGDEADAVPSVCFDGIETCQTGGFLKELYFFNPRSRQGRIYRMVKSGKYSVVHLNAFRHPSVIDNVDYWPGTANRRDTARRVAEWTRPVAEGEDHNKPGYYKMPDFMVGHIPLSKSKKPYPAIVKGYYKIEDQQFYDVVLGEYPAQSENQLISEEWTDKARSRYDLFVAKHGVITPVATGCTASLDIAEKGIDSSVLTKRFGNFVHPQVEWQGKDTIEVADEVKKELEGLNVLAIYCDSTGVGAGTAPYLTRQYNLPAVRVMVANSPTETSEMGVFGLLLDQLMWALREWLKNDMAMLPPDPGLIEELLAFEYTVKNGKIKVSSTDDIKDLLKRSPDKARSLMLSFHPSGVFGGMDLS